MQGGETIYRCHRDHRLAAEAFDLRADIVAQISKPIVTRHSIGVRDRHSDDGLEKVLAQRLAVTRRRRDLRERRTSSVQPAARKFARPAVALANDCRHRRVTTYRRSCFASAAVTCGALGGKSGLPVSSKLCDFNEPAALPAFMRSSSFAPAGISAPGVRRFAPVMSDLVGVGDIHFGGFNIRKGIGGSLGPMRKG